MNRIDLLNRDEFVENVIKIVNVLSENEKGCCFAIEGGWGIGKTFVIEEIEEQLKKIQSEKNNSDRYFVFNYNCWKYDYYEEPSVAIISAMLASIQEDASFVNSEVDGVVTSGWGLAKDKLKEIAGLYIENKIGVNLISLFEEVDEKSKQEKEKTFEFDEMFSFGQTMEKVREKLKEIAKERTIVLIVDELDRCIPKYAIKVLERLHHIFYGLENVVVILSIDRKQLEHSVEEMFGSRRDEASIDIEKYLKKFIDFSMVLDNGTINQSFKEKYQFYYHKFLGYEEKELNEMLPMLLSGIDIRRQEKIIEKANIVHSLICNEKVDLCVLAFEIMYEVLQAWEFGDMKYVALIGNAHYKDLEERIGKEKIEMLVLMEEKARRGSGNRKAICSTLYGKVFWYFANIYNENNIPYVQENGQDEQIAKQLEVAKRYCDFCKIIK